MQGSEKEGAINIDDKSGTPDNKTVIIWMKVLLNYFETKESYQEKVTQKKSYEIQF